MTEKETERRLVCCECGDRIEWCAFCDGDECEKAICFRCVIVKVRQEIAEMHPHGG